jgi:predicted DNA-binding transcriptional regulator AlpA
MQAEIITNSKIGLLDIKQVAELTTYKEETIRLRKAEIGWHTLGKDLKFKASDVEAWINRYYRAPISKRR